MCIRDSSKIEHKGEVRIRVDFPYDAMTIQTIKQLNGSRWSQSKKCWHLPYSKEVYALLQQHFEVSLPTEATTKSPTQVAKVSEPTVATSTNSATIVEEIVRVVPEHDFRVKVFIPYHRKDWICLLYTSPSPRDQRGSRMPSSA